VCRRRGRWMRSCWRLVSLCIRYAFNYFPRLFSGDVLFRKDCCSCSITLAIVANSNMTFIFSPYTAIDLTCSMSARFGNSCSSIHSQDGVRGRTHSKSLQSNHQEREYKKMRLGSCKPGESLRSTPLSSSATLYAHGRRLVRRRRTAHKAGPVIGLQLRRGTARFADMM